MSLNLSMNNRLAMIKNPMDMVDYSSMTRATKSTKF